MLFQYVVPHFILFTHRPWAARAIKLWMCMPVEGFYCCFCSCFLWEQGKSMRGTGSKSVLTRDLCFWSNSVVTVLLGNLPWFVSASLIWTSTIFNKHFYSYIPNSSSFVILRRSATPRNTCLCPSPPAGDLPPADTMLPDPALILQCLRSFQVNEIFPKYIFFLYRYRTKYQLIFLHFTLF